MILRQLTRCMIGGALAAIAPHTAASQAAAPSSDSVLVSFLVDAGYDDSERSVDMILRMLETLPPTIAVVSPGESLPALILRLYEVSNVAPDGRVFESRL